MTDKVMPVVSIMLDKERHLKFGLKALKAIEGATKKNTLSGEFWGRPSAHDFSALLWAGLLHEEPSLTIEQTDDLVDNYSSIGAISESIAEAWGAAMPEPEEDKGADKESPLASTG